MYITINIPYREVNFNGHAAENRVQKEKFEIARAARRQALSNQVGREIAGNREKYFLLP